MVAFILQNKAAYAVGCFNKQIGARCVSHPQPLPSGRSPANLQRFAYAKNNLYSPKYWTVFFAYDTSLAILR